MKTHCYIANWIARTCDVSHIDDRQGLLLCPDPEGPILHAIEFPNSKLSCWLLKQPILLDTLVLLVQQHYETSGYELEIQQSDDFAYATMEFRDTAGNEELVVLEMTEEVLLLNVSRKAIAPHP